MSRSLGNRAATLLFPNKTATAFARVRSLLLPKQLSSTVSAVDVCPTVDYLVESCGLSSKSALSVSKKIKLRTMENPESVVGILKGHGFSDGQIATAITKWPKMLSMKPEVNVAAKLDFFRSIGFSAPEVASLVSTNPHLLRYNLKERMVPEILQMMKLVPSKEAAITVLKNSSSLLMSRCLFNMETLRSHGMPEHMVIKAFLRNPRSVMCVTDHFTEAIHKAKELGLEPRNPIFTTAVLTISYMTGSTWERKMALYMSLGWSDDQLRLLFRKQPCCFAASDASIKERMSFFTNKLGWDPMVILSNPSVLTYSLEKRLIPRCSVLGLLMSKGLIKKKTRFVSQFQISEKNFLLKYVEKYKNQLPQVVEAYQGKMAFEGWL